MKSDTLAHLHGGMAASLGGMAVRLCMAKFEEEQAKVGKIQGAIERRR